MHLKKHRLDQWVFAVLLTSSLLIAGCSRDLVDENTRPPSVDRVSLADVQTKVDLISHDECFHEEPEAVYQRCGGRYMTEIRNLGLTAQQYATTHSPEADRINHAVGAIENDLSAFRKHSCDTARPSALGRCAAILRDVNTQLTVVGTGLRSMSEPVGHP